jgi:hypothetical protein
VDFSDSSNNDVTHTHFGIFATRCARVFANSSALEVKRAQGRPGARCTRGLACKSRIETHTSIQVQRRQSGLPCAMVYGLFRALPGETRACLSPSPSRSVLLANLTPAIGASGPHDFTVRERLRSSFASSTSTASRRACRDVRNAPLIGRDGVVLKCIG